MTSESTIASPIDRNIPGDGLTGHQWVPPLFRVVYLPNTSIDDFPIRGDKCETFLKKLF